MIEQIKSEQSKIIELRSLEDQIKKIFAEAHFIQQQVDDLKIDINGKADLVSKSQSLNSVTTENALGSGVISSSGVSDGTSIAIIGAGTYFTAEIASAGLSIVNRSIRIGSSSYPVLTITDDTHLTISSAVNIPAINEVFYAITKPATAEQFVGDFEYGETNGRLFNGRINQKSILRHFGRIADPFDVVNVQYVQGITYPILVKALQAIQRTGDIVGINEAGAAYYRYDYNNCNFFFDNSAKNISGQFDPGSGNQNDPDNPGSHFVIRSFHVQILNSNFDIGGPRELPSDQRSSTDARYYGPITDNNNIITKEFLDQTIANMPFTSGEYISETNHVIRWVRMGEFVICTGTDIIAATSSNNSSTHKYVSLQPNTSGNPTKIGVKYSHVSYVANRFTDTPLINPDSHAVKIINGHSVDLFMQGITTFLFADIAHTPIGTPKERVAHEGSHGRTHPWGMNDIGVNIDTTWTIMGIGSLQEYESNSSWSACGSHCYSHQTCNCEGHCGSYCHCEDHCGGGDRDRGGTGCG